MAKSASPPPEVELYFILPVISGLRKLGTVIAKQGSASVMHEFEYTDANDLTAAIIRVTRDLTERKQEVQTSAAAKGASKTASASAPVAQNDAETAAENSSETTDNRADNAPASSDDLLTTISDTTAVHSNDALDATSVTDKRGQLSLM